MPTGGLDVAAGSALAGLLGETGAGILGGAALGGEIGAGVGGLSSGLSGGNPLMGAWHGGLSGAASGGLFAGAGAALDGVGGLSGIGNSIGDVFGNPTFGSDIAGGLSEFGNGVSNLFGSGGSAGSPTSDLFTNAARDATSAGATSGAPSLTGYTPAEGLSTLGGGSAGGFVNAPEIGGLDSAAGSGFSNAPDINLGNFNNSFSSAAPDAFSGAGQQLAQGGGKVAGSGLFGNNQMTNGVIKSLLSGALTNTNQSGYQGMNQAAQQAVGAYQPFLQSGQAANHTLSDLYGSNGAEAQQAAQGGFQNNPGYQFARDQGISALDASAAAKGNLLSGNQIKAVQDYGTGLANQTYQQYVGNLQNQAGLGANAAGGYGNALAGGANALAQGGQANANANNQMFGGIANALFPTNNGIDPKQLMALLGGSGGGNNNILQSLFG